MYILINFNEMFNVGLDNYYYDTKVVVLVIYFVFNLTFIYTKRVYVAVACDVLPFVLVFRFCFVLIERRCFCTPKQLAGSGPTS